MGSIKPASSLSGTQRGKPMAKRRNVSKTRSGAQTGARGAVIFAESFVSSEQFTSLFREGMSLVEETATYLDGKGREDSRRLPRLAALGYATESMRLTTRLMQLASWLLLQRAVGEGELSRIQAERDKARITLKDVQLPSSKEGLANLPQGLGALVVRSLRIQERICHLDRQITASLADETRPPLEGDNPVNEQIARLRSALLGVKP
jgi:regulator of CtrA degradation